MSSTPKYEPPKWADWFLALFCNPKLLEQLQGDVHELFYWRLEEKGFRRAKWSFVWDVIRLFRWSNIRRTKKQGQKLNQIAMFKNYFKVGLRNLWKQRMPSTINIIGLSIAIGCAIVSFKFVDFNYVKDDFHKNKDDIFFVTHWEEIETNKGRSGATDHQLSREILNAVPGIKASTRYNSIQLQARLEKRINYNLAFFVDPEYLQMFSFELLAGNPNSLQSADQIIIDENTATALFGDDLGIDKQLEVKIGDAWKVFTVGAVYKNRPANSSLQLNMLINYRAYEQYSTNRESWNTNFFIQRQKGVEEETLLAAMDKLLPVFNKDNEDGAYSYFELEPLTTMANNAYSISASVGAGPNMAPIITLSAIAVFMLLLSTLNYVNISLAMVMKRLKEIGVRKVIGSARKQLIIQFLTENFLLCTLSMLLGLLLAHALFLPGFNSIAGSSFELNLIEQPRFSFYLGALLIFITLASGLYPAIVASSLKPISILRKATHKSGNRILSNVFLTFQMILAMVTIVAAVMFVYTNRVNQSLDWGYDQENKLVVGIPGDEYKEAFREALVANPNVVNLAGTQHNIGQALNGWQFQNGEVKTYAEFFSVDRNYPKVLGLQLVEGRMFDESLASDLEQKLIVNEAFLNNLQLKFEPEGTFIRQDSTEYRIIGVVEDYYYYNPGQKIRGAAMKAIPNSEATSFLVEMVEGDIFTQRDQLKASLQEMVTEQTVYVGLQELMFDNFYNEINGIRNIMLFTASVAILLAAMGLYGLVNINVTDQMKDFGIRKVLGATGMNLANTVMRRFRWVILLAILIGCPIAALLVDMLINDIYAYAPAVGAGPLSLAIIILVSVALLTFAFQIQKVRKMNPSETLRTE